MTPIEWNDSIRIRGTFKASNVIPGLRDLLGSEWTPKLELFSVERFTSLQITICLNTGPELSAKETEELVNKCKSITYGSENNPPKPHGI